MPSIFEPEHPFGIANRLIEYGILNRKPLSVAKLQCLLCCAHGWSLSFLDTPLVGESFLAAGNGPELASVREELACYAGVPILHKICEPVVPVGTQKIEVLVRDFKDNSGAVFAILANVWQSYGGMSEEWVLRLILKEGSPWHISRSRSRTTSHPEILESDFREYYNNSRVVYGTSRCI